MSDTIIIAFSEEEFQTLQGALEVAIIETRTARNAWYYFSNNQEAIENSEAELAQLLALRERIKEQE